MPEQIDTSREAIARLSFEVGLGDLVGVGRRVSAALDALQVRAEAAEAERDALRAKVDTWTTAFDVNAGMAEEQRTRAEAAEAEVARLQEMLADPNTVHINMLRGTIAKPSVDQIRHIYGDSLASGYEADRPAEPTHKHIKRGTTYTEIGRGELQVSTTPGCSDGDAVVIYRGANGLWWVRPSAEFDDPTRFEPIKVQGS